MDRGLSLRGVMVFMARYPALSTTFLLRAPLTRALCCYPDHLISCHGGGRGRGRGRWWRGAFLLVDVGYTISVNSCEP